MSDTALGDAIRQRRRELSLTQEDLEARTGMTQSYLSQLERGRIRRPSRENVVALADALEMDHAVLLQLADYSAGSVALTDADIDRVAQAVVDRLVAKAVA